MAKIGKYIGFWVYRRSYLLWSPVILTLIGRAEKKRGEYHQWGWRKKTHTHTSKRTNKQTTRETDKPNETKEIYISKHSTREHEQKRAGTDTSGSKQQALHARARTREHSYAQAVHASIARKHAPGGCTAPASNSIPVAGTNYSRK